MEVLKCSVCQQEKPKHNFSNTQWKKGRRQQKQEEESTKGAKCKDCIRRIESGSPQSVALIPGQRSNGLDSPTSSLSSDHSSNNASVGALSGIGHYDRSGAKEKKKSRIETFVDEVAKQPLHISDSGGSSDVTLLNEGVSEVSKKKGKKRKSQQQRDLEQRDIDANGAWQPESRQVEGTLPPLHGLNNKVGVGAQAESCLSLQKRTGAEDDTKDAHINSVVEKMVEFYSFYKPSRATYRKAHRRLLCDRYKGNEKHMWTFLYKKYKGIERLSPIEVQEMGTGKKRRREELDDPMNPQADGSGTTKDNHIEPAKGLGFQSLGQSKQASKARLTKTGETKISPAVSGTSKSAASECGMACNRVPGPPAFYKEAEGDQPPQQQPQPQPQPPPPQQRVCDRCDGPHATAACPHFRKGRENHPDALRRREALTDMGSAGGNVVVSGARLVRQPGDGSCLFHSLAYGLRRLEGQGLLRSTGGAIGSGGGGGGRCWGEAWGGGSSGSRSGGGGGGARHLRGDIARWLMTHPNTQISGTPVRQWVKWDSGLKLERYAKRMASSGSWGGGIELAGCSLLKGVNVHVYERCRSGGSGGGSGGGGGGSFLRISRFGDAHPGRTVHVVYCGGVHYDALNVEGATFLKGASESSKKAGGGVRQRLVGDGATQKRRKRSRGFSFDSNIDDNDEYNSGKSKKSRAGGHHSYSGTRRSKFQQQRKNRKAVGKLSRRRW